MGPSIVQMRAFVVGMFLTPPDAISQTLLALPMYVLYESGLIMARIMLRNDLNKKNSDGSDGSA